MTNRDAVTGNEKCAEHFSAWTDGIRKMLLEAGEKNAAARVDGYSFETFKAGYDHALAPTAEQADAVRANGRRVPLNLTYEQISALYLLLLRRERPEYGWMEAPLVAIEEGLKPAHNAIHDRGFNSLNRQFFGDDRFKFDESAVPTEIAPASSAGDQA